ncbi:MAG: hypothetical protein V3S37_06725 [Dehalococcoidia bacterium]
MTTKAFILLLVGVLALGGSIGGAFAGGIALGKSQVEEAAPASPFSLPQSNQSQQLPGQLGQDQLDQFRQQIQNGELSPDQLDQFRQRFQGRGGGGGGFAGRNALTGTIESTEGNTIIVSTAQGPLEATLGADTTIQMSVEGTLEDLTEGTQVTVVGQRGEDGTVEATSIVIVPAGGGGLFGGFIPSDDTH